MFTDFSQERIIDNVNRKLKQYDAPIRLNADGICSGLVYLALEAFLKKDEQIFFS